MHPFEIDKPLINDSLDSLSRIILDHDLQRLHRIELASLLVFGPSFTTVLKLGTGEVLIRRNQ